MGRAVGSRAALIVALVAAVMAGCGKDQSAVRSVSASPRATTTTSAMPETTPTLLPPTDAVSGPPGTAAAVPGATADPPSASASASAGGPSQAPSPGPPRAIDEIGDTGGASRVITVVSSSWSDSTASLTLWERVDGSWARAGGPWDAHVGGGGWAYEPGEGTRRSPVGSFGFGTGFGLQADPGYAGGWFGIGDTDYWVEDPASPDYNTHRQGPVDPAQAPWGHFEHLVDFPVAYRYVALIDFNVPPRGGIGSGIFLHVSTGDATAGCVSLPEDELVTTLRWIDPATTRVVMGPESELAKL